MIHQHACLLLRVLSAKEVRCEILYGLSWQCFGRTMSCSRESRKHLPFHVSDVGIDVYARLVPDSWMHAELAERGCLPSWNRSGCMCLTDVVLRDVDFFCRGLRVLKMVGCKWISDGGVIVVSSIVLENPGA